jgi:glycosidase
MIERLLFLSKNDNINLVISKVNFDFKDLIDEIFRETRIIDNSHVLTNEGKPCLINADRSLIKQMIRALLDNALKYTGNNGEITLGCYSSNDIQTFYIKDNGIEEINKYIAMYGNINTFTVNGRNTAQNDRFNYLSKLLNWRRTKTVIHTGLLTQYVPENDVYVYFRYNEKEKVMVIMNNNETDQTVKTARYAESLAEGTAGKDVMTGITYDLKTAITVPKQTVLILEIQ